MYYLDLDKLLGFKKINHESIDKKHKHIIIFDELDGIDIQGDQNSSYIIFVSDVSLGIDVVFGESLKPCRLTEPFFLFVPEGDKLLISSTGNASGYVVRFTPSNFYGFFDIGINDDFNMLKEYFYFSFKDFSSSIEKVFYFCANSLYEDMKRKIKLSYFDILSIIDFVLYQTKISLLKRREWAIKSKTRKEEILDKFLILVKNESVKYRCVDYYSKKIGISSSQLRRICQEVLNKKPLEVINGNLMELAKYKIVESNKSIQEISFLLGYNDAAYFSQCFRKYTGLSPSEYREKIMLDR